MRLKRRSDYPHRRDGDVHKNRIVSNLSLTHEVKQVSSTVKSSISIITEAMVMISFHLEAMQPNCR